MTQMPVASALTTLPLAPGNHPFALSAEELLLDGDWWAWQFLRRNPFYRRDYDLQANVPEPLVRRKNQPIWIGMGPHPKGLPDGYGEFDCRYFCAHGQVLSGDVDWPICKPLSLTSYLQRHPDISTLDITIREFDSAVTYGITWWFDPLDPDLPLLAAGQSWFYNLVEPLWEVGDPDVRLVEAFYTDARFGKAIVGFSRDEPLRAVALEHVRFETRHLAEGKPELVKVPIERPWSRGFASPTDLAFLVSLDEEVASQLRPLKRLASGLSAISKPAAMAARPLLEANRAYLILRADHGLALQLARLQGHLINLAKQPRRQRANWRVVHLDVINNIEKQFDDIQAELLQLQSALDKQRDGALKRIKRKRNASPRDFWLKKFLCMLELQEGLTAHNGGKPPGAEHLGQAIFDPEHPLHRVIRSGVEGPSSPVTSDAFARETEPYKDALKRGRDIALGLYEYLVGQMPGELRTE